MDRATTEAYRRAESRYGPHVHRCPLADSGIMPCCGRTPFEVPRWHRMTLDPALVNCTEEGEPNGRG